jgi:dTDP-6-deoxy-L-talose 4-dehydrogenase (NAD+)
MRIFVTGASGFIGRHLCDALEGHELLALMRQPRQLPANVRQLQGDLFEPTAWRDAVKDFAPEGCIHLAWSDLPDYSLAPSRKNFEAGLDLLQMMKEIGCPRVVVAGTCFEYGNLPGLVSEEQVPKTQGLFAAFKSAQRVVGNSLLANSSTQLIWTRLFYVFGRGQRPTSLIPSCIAALMAGKKPDIRNPDAVADLVHVEDVAGGLAALITASGVEGTYNIGSGVGSRVRDAANLVARLLGQQDVYPPSQEPGQGFWADMQRLRQDCGWTPKVSLEEGIARTLRAWKAER